MAGTILVKNLLDRVSRSLGDIQPQFAQWIQREMVTWLNDAQRAVAKYLPTACARTDVIKLVAGARQSIAAIASASIKPGDGSAAANVRGNTLQFVGCLMGADGLTAGASLSIVDKDTLDACNPNWRLAAATGKLPVEYTFDPRNPQIFYVNPGIPAADTVWIEVSMLADPIDVPNTGSEDYKQTGSSTQVMSVDDKVVDDLYHYMMARAHLQNVDNPASAGLVGPYSQLFTSSINAQALAATGVNPNLQSLPMNPQTPASAR